ncbi:protease inhibitor I42 family protein [Zoogloea sp. LCSB751]|uniref:protease inhibitor I42 family protein n=1 Tax=Zoogloea sp. LCSB751 TaxID=1965277 RepID=UPI00137476A9|nr:protease inhibitor I42 family protein [Zoogloea sp. LCSB751]
MSTRIQTPVGTPFCIDLDATPSSGYLWSLPALPYGVERVDSSVIPPGGAPPGALGRQHFVLRTTQAGHYRVDFLLKREWETQPIATHTVSVIAH